MKKCLLINILVLFIMVPVFSQSIILSDEINSFRKTGETINSISYKSNIGNLFIKQIEKDGHTYNHLYIENYGTSLKAGEPSLPVFKKIIPMAYHKDVIVKIKKTKSREIDLSEYGNYLILPAQEPISAYDSSRVKKEFLLDNKVYTSDTYINEELVKVTDVGIMRDQHLSLLEINPIVYFPHKNIIEIFNEIEFEILSEKQIQNSYSKKYYSPYFTPFYKSFDLNYKLKNVESKVRYIIISDPQYSEDIQPLINWKKQKGFLVEDYYTNDPSVGSDTASIKNFLFNLFENANGDKPAPTFVLLVGDVQEIPSFPYRVDPNNVWFQNHITDLYYFEYTNDFIPEVLYGRFSVSNSEEAKAQVAKTIEYEKYQLESPDFLSEAVLCSGYDENPFINKYIDGYTYYLAENYYNASNKINAYTYFSEESKNYPPEIKNYIMQGVGNVNYCGHAGGGYGFNNADFNVDDIKNMTNFKKYSFMIGHCCYPNKFERDDTFGEVLVQEPQKGGIGFIGSTNAIWWDPTYWWGIGYRNNIVANPQFDSLHLGAYDRLFHTKISDDLGVSTQAQVLFAGNLAVVESGPRWSQFYWETFHLMGDPSLMPYLNQPDSIHYKYKKHFSLNEPRKLNLSKGLMVSITDYDFNNVKTFIVDETELIDLEEIPVGEYKLTITGQNKILIETEIVIYDEAKPFVALKDFSFTNSNKEKVDEMLIKEFYLMNLSFENLGLENSEEIQIRLLYDENLFYVEDSVSFLPSINSMDKFEAYGIYKIKIIEDANTSINNHNFRLEINENGQKHEYLIPVKTQFPQIEFIKTEVTDQFSGNNNQIIENGELVEIIVACYNSSNVICNNITGILSCDNKKVEILNGIQDVNINKNAVENFKFYALISEEIAQGTRLEFVFESNFLKKPAFLQIIQYVGNVIDFEKPGNVIEIPYVVNSSIEKWYYSNQKALDGFCFRSPRIRDNGYTELKIMYPNGVVGDSIVLNIKVGTEEGKDIFSIKNGGKLIGEWSGYHDWKRVTIPFEKKGLQFIQLMYKKNDSIKSHSDDVRIDNIVLPTQKDSLELTLVGSVIPGYRICNGDSVLLLAKAYYGYGDYSYSFNSTREIELLDVNKAISFPAENSTYEIFANDKLTSKKQVVNIEVFSKPDRPIIEFNDTLIETNSSLHHRWYLNDTLMPNYDLSYLSPIKYGEYYVEVVNQKGCISSKSDKISFMPIANDSIITDTIVYDKLVIFPNPSSQYFNIKIPLKEKNNSVQISIYSLDGQKIRSFEYLNIVNKYLTVKKNITDIPSGVYLVRVNVNGEQVSIKKYIISR